MPSVPNLASWGNSFTEYAGEAVLDGTPKGEINYETLNATTIVDGVEWTHFDETIKDFVLARLG